MQCIVICVTSLYIIAIFIIWDMVIWAAARSGVTVIQSHHLQNGMSFARAGALFNHNQEWVSHLGMLWYQKWFVFISRPCIVQQAIFVTWRVPLHNDEGKHNLISTVIYRTDCPNGVITISSASPCPLSHPHLCPPRALCLLLPYSFLEECIWNHANENKWTNECFMNAFMMRKCKWGWVNEWMFNERLFNEKDLLTRALT